MSFYTVNMLYYESFLVLNIFIIDISFKNIKNSNKQSIIKVYSTI